MRVLGCRPIAFYRARQSLQPDTRVAHQRKCGVLEGIDFGDVDADKAYVRILEGGFGRRREIGQAGSDGNDQVCIARRDIGARRAGNANGAEVLWVVECQRALSCLGLPNGNAGLGRKARQRFAWPRCRSRRRPPQSGACGQPGSTAAACASRTPSGSGRAMCQTRFWNISSG